MRFPQFNRGPQEYLGSCLSDEVFFGGAKGGGKTFGLLTVAFYLALKHRKAFNGLFVRLTAQELAPVILDAIAMYSDADPGVRFVRNGAGATCYFSNGAVLTFSYADDKKRGRKQGGNYTHLFVDEAGTFPDKALYLRLVQEVRPKLIVPGEEPIKCQIFLTGNPGGPGDGWLNEMFVAERDGMNIERHSYTHQLLGPRSYQTRSYTETLPAITDHFGGVIVPERPYTRTYVESMTADNPAYVASGYEERLRRTMMLFDPTGTAVRQLVGAEWGLHRSGRIFPRELFVHDATWRPVRLVWSWDTAYSTRAGSSYSAGVLVGVDQYGRPGVVEVVRCRAEFDELAGHVVRGVHRYPTAELLIESKASGLSLVQHLLTQHGIRATAFNPATIATGNADDAKAARLSIAAMLCRHAGGVMVNPEQSWYADFATELTSQPDWREKDQADAFAHGVYWMLQCNQDATPLLNPDYLAAAMAML